VVRRPRAKQESNASLRDGERRVFRFLAEGYAILLKRRARSVLLGGSNGEQKKAEGVLAGEGAQSSLSGWIARLSD
jgi:hypothetical protein